MLDDLGLIPALHSFVKIFSKRTRIHVHLTGVCRRGTTGHATSAPCSYRVAQEALTNVSRHAQASRVEVNIQKLPDGVCMKINDNGKSFQVERVLNAKGSKRLGLLGMRERLEMVGGRFDHRIRRRAKAPPSRRRFRSATGGGRWRAPIKPIILK